MNDVYAQEIIERYKNPRNRRAIKADAQSEGANPLCGDELKVMLKTSGGVVEDAAFSGEGCAISTAAADILCDYARKKSAAHLRKMTDARMLGLLGVKVGPGRAKCALLALNTMKKTLEGI